MPHGTDRSVVHDVLMAIAGPIFADARVLGVEPLDEFNEGNTGVLAIE